MKKAPIILLLFFVFSQIYGQKRITVVIPNDSVQVRKNLYVPVAYDVSLYLKSTDERFKLDNYSFQVINGKSFDELPFNMLKKPFNSKDFEDVMEYKDLVKMKPCKVHEILSLANNIFLIESKNQTEFFWRMHYIGTSKYGGITDY